MRDAHLLLAKYNAWQPGVFALSGWDLVGAVPLARDQVTSLIATGDTRWIERGAIDYARLILALDRRQSAVDHAGEPWATPVQDTRLDETVTGGARLDDRSRAPALLAVASNEAQLTMAGATQSQPFVVNGQMRGIAVSGPTRLASVPNLPTFRELGWPQPDAGTWQGILVQGNTPPATVARLEREIRAVLEDPAVKARVAELGGAVKAEGSAAFRQWMRAETENVGRVIRDNNIRLDP